MRHRLRGSRRVLFKHALLRDVTYESVPSGSAAAFTERLPVVNARSGERVDEYAGTIAEHYQWAKSEAEAAEGMAARGQQAARLTRRRPRLIIIARR